MEQRTNNDYPDIRMGLRLSARQTAATTLRPRASSSCSSASGSNGIHAARDAARADVFDDIELFYNTWRRHGYSDGLSQVQYERKTS